MFSFDFLHNCDGQFYLPLYVLGKGQISPRSTSVHFCFNYVQRTWSAPGWSACSIFSALLLLPQRSCTLVSLRRHALEQGVPPFPHSPLFSLSFFFTHLPLYPGLPFRSHRTSTFHFVPFQPSSPYLGKASQQVLQQVEPSIYILFWANNPADALRNRDRTCRCIWAEMKACVKS